MRGGEGRGGGGVCHGGRGHKSKLSASRSKFPIESDLSTVVNVWVK